MNIVKILKTAKALLSSVKLSEAHLVDDTVISYEGDYIDVGSTVYIKDEAGDWIVISDGSYETKEGFKFTVVDGVVSEVDDNKPMEVEQCDCNKKVKKEGEAETIAEDVVIEAAPEILEAITEAIAEAIAPLEAEIAELKKNLKSQSTSLSMVNSAVTQLSKLPSANAIEENLIGSRKVNKESRVAQMIEAARQKQK